MKASTRDKSEQTTTERDRARAFEPRLDLVPEEPGVYLMKDDAGSVIYVGKARSLRRRLRDYFVPHPEGNAKVLAMIEKIAAFETLVCRTEWEAFALEANLIKEYRPHYNILMRDDKEYPYIKVTLQEAYPRVEKAFHVEDDVRDGARYFGPWPAGDLNRALKALKTLFPLRSCRRDLPREIGRERPCLYYHIGRCCGPCTGEIDAKAYRAMVDDVIRFLEGRYGELTAALKARMDEAAERLDFERAAAWREQWRALVQLAERQHVIDPEGKDMDAVAVARNGSDVSVFKLEVRGGRVTSRVQTFAEDTGEDDGDYIESFIRTHYTQNVAVPPLVLVSALPESSEAAAAFLSARLGRKVTLRRPRRGDKKAVLDLAAMNAKNALMRHTLMGGRSRRALDETLARLGELAGCPGAPRRIEAYDISHFGGEDVTGSMVVFADGRPARKAYRHFRIRRAEGNDDYAALRDVLARRLARLGDETFGARPDLILLDGGAGQIGAVRDLAEGAGIPLAGMVKDRRHRTRGLVLTDGRVIELSVSPEGEEENADERARRLGLLRLVTAIQDEAHRFAGRLRHKVGTRRRTAYRLETIPGVGEARRKALLRHFGTIRAIAEATPDELAGVPGLPRKVAEAVYAHFHAET